MTRSRSPRGLLHDDPRPERFRVSYAPPSRELAELVEATWITRWTLPPGEEHPQRVLAHPCVHVVVDATGESGVFGIPTGVFERTLAGGGRAVGIKFRPGTFHALLGRPVASITDGCLGLEEVFGRAGVDYQRAVLATDDDARLVELADSFLAALRPGLGAEAALARDLVECIAADRELTAVEELARRAGQSPRWLQRLFHRHVGVSPKWVIQRYRLHEAVARLEGQAHVDHADLAARLGYSDQSHFVRDFRRLVGRAPGRYARRARP